VGLQVRKEIIMAAKKSKPAQPKKPKPARPKSPNEEIPPGATRKAMERPFEPSGGGPGSAGGPRHAADDLDTENEHPGFLDTTRTPASIPIDLETEEEKGPPYASRSGSAVGGTPAQLRSAEREVRSDPDAVGDLEPERLGKSRLGPSSREAGMKRLTGFEAIEYAEKQGLALNKHPDSLTGPRTELTVAEAAAIADEDPDLIWLDVDEEDYYNGPPTNFEPDR